MYMVVCIRWGVSLIKTSNYLRTRKGTDGQTDRQTDRQTDSVLASSTEGCKLVLVRVRVRVRVRVSTLLLHGT